MSPNAQSWIETANAPNCDFPLQNLPYCAFRNLGMQPHLGMGIGDSILDLNVASRTDLFKTLPWEIRSACRSVTLNRLMKCGNTAASQLRNIVSTLLSDKASSSEIDKLKPCLYRIDQINPCKPVSIPNYTDFYASIDHAANVGKLFRPDQPLLPNYKYIPIGYHGRASSIVVSDTPITRPSGQFKLPSSYIPSFAPSRQLDYELEVAAYISTGNILGHPIDITKAQDHLFGISLLNDWSARDIQSWEYQPLGPFLGKSFATSISPWVVSMDALQPYLVHTQARPHSDPKPLPYLISNKPAAIDLQLEAFLATAKTRAANLPPHKLSATNFRDLYWTFPQLVAHHTSNGCNLLPGDLLASGTVSGPTPGSQGSLLEITQRGTNPLHLPNGEHRTFLEDGDEVILRGFCQSEGLPRIGLGECRGAIVPAKP